MVEVSSKTMKQKARIGRQCNNKNHLSLRLAPCSLRFVRRPGPGAAAEESPADRVSIGVRSSY